MDPLPPCLMVIVREYDFRNTFREFTDLFHKKNEDFLNVLNIFISRYTKLDYYLNGRKVTTSVSILSETDTVMIVYKCSSRIDVICYTTNSNYDQYRILWDSMDAKVYGRAIFCGPATTIGDYWLDRTQWKHVMFSGMSRLQTIGKDFLSCCPELIKVDFKELKSLRSVGGCWLWKCVKLKIADFKGLSELREVGDYWLDSCRVLTRLKLQDLMKLERVGIFWLASCDELASADFRSMCGLKKVGFGWLCQCPLLLKVNTNGLQLQDIGEGCFVGSSHLNSSKILLAIRKRKRID